MNRCKFIWFYVNRTALSYFDHLPQLLIANESLINFQNSLLKYEINRVPYDLLGIRSDHMFPNPFIQIKFHPFARMFIETLKISAVDIDPLSIGATHTEIVLNLIGNGLPLHYFFGLLLPLPQIIVVLPSQNILRIVQESIFLPNSRKFANFDHLSFKQETWRIPHSNINPRFDRTQKFQQRTAIIDVSDRLIFLIVLLLPWYFGRHSVELFSDHLTPLDSVRFNIATWIFLYRYPSCTFLQAVVDDPV